ncbi:hypothetical protein CTI12_AA140480 [Artemisia annua]|uniref:Uncharacterized protein n=1 Tax=Artemisia annua TaxID=35608 RepID=A0A2U1PL83_ARTAN|nr:hypothetical protein CTI12_AA140480 [Artemisia annua]
MDPNPKKFPILSYVMSKLPSRNNNTSPDFDIEQPPLTAADSSNTEKPYFEITERMPYLNDPDLINSMRATVADVSRTRSVLKTLGECPDHEFVDIARARLAEMDKDRVADVADRLDDVSLTVDEVKDGKDEVEDKERHAFEAVIKVYEMHQSYEKMLSEAEMKLEKLYNAAKRGGKGGKAVASGEGEEGSSRGLDVDGEDEGVTEEVVGILNDAMASNAERVDLSEKRLPFLPEAFGKLKMLVSLKLSSNQLEVVFDCFICYLGMQCYWFWLCRVGLF